MSSILLKNTYILNPGTERSNPFDFYKGDILVEKGIIKTIRRDDTSSPPIEPGPDVKVIDNNFRRMAFPGFIQSHIHFCQTLHRNRAEEMPLMKWLKEEIWPHEGAHTRESISRAVVMSLKEIIRSGTTAVLDMGTVHHQQVIFQLMAKAGFRYTGGKAMMDHCPDAPEGLNESTEESINASMALYERYNGSYGGLLHYAFAPRFVLSCSTDLLKEVRRLSDKHAILIHTHASEHPEEVAYIKEQYGHGNIAYLDKIGALNNHTVIAHMVHLDEDEKQLALDKNISIAHCPTTNLKLGSGIAPIAQYLEKDMWVGLGCDGAPCNNSLSIFNELKLAPLLQKGINNNPLLVTPGDALRLVSINGAKILRQQDRIGQIRENMDADLVLLDMDTPQTYNFQHNPEAALVYGADARNVYGTMVKGKFLYLDGSFSKEIMELENS